MIAEHGYWIVAAIVCAVGVIRLAKEDFKAEEDFSIFVAIWLVLSMGWIVSLPMMAFFATAKWLRRRLKAVE
jgi:hypothetical protein